MMNDPLPKQRKSPWTAWAEAFGSLFGGIAFAVIVLAFFLGIGGCFHLLKMDANQPLIKIEQHKP